MNFVRKFARFCRDAFKHFLDVDSIVRSSALAYTSLLALAPLTMLAFGILSAFPAFGGYIHHLNAFLFRHFVPESADVIYEYITSFANQASKLSLVGLFFSIITAVLLIFTMEEALNRVWEVRRTHHRRGIQAFLMYWAMITLLPLVGGMIFATIFFVYSFPEISFAVEIISAYVPIFIILPIVVTWFFFLILYMTLPNCKVKFRHAALGALIAAILFEGMKALFGLYIRHFSSDLFIYGALAAIPIFLVWLYCSWILVLFGGVISHLLAVHRNE